MGDEGTMSDDQAARAEAEATTESDGVHGTAGPDEIVAPDEAVAPDVAAPPEVAAAPEVAVAPDEAVARDTALDLAGLHLRLGSLALARAELETLAGRGVLDATARIDLAEVRWRTGDLVGGGEAARESLAGGGDAVVTLVIAAEAASALGRPSEARRLAGRAMSLHAGPIDPVFAGMPRSSVWPGDPAEPVPSSSTLFPPERSDAAAEADRDEAALLVEDQESLATAAGGAAAAEAAAPSGEPGLWDLHEAAALAAGTAAMDSSDLDPSALFDAGRAALETGDLSTAAVNLGLVVRLAPALAPAVLSVIGDPFEAGLLLVQGDAYRAVGHESEARRSYAAAMAVATTPSSPSSVEWFGTTPPAERPAPAWWLQTPAEHEPPDEPVESAEPALPFEAIESDEPVPTDDAASFVEPEPPEAEHVAEPEPPPAESFGPEPQVEPGSLAEPVEAPAEPQPPELDREPDHRPHEGERRTDQDEWRNDG